MKHAQMAKITNGGGHTFPLLGDLPKLLGKGFIVK